jgi:hypothetical protein
MIFFKKHGRKTGNTKKTAIAMILLCGISIVAICYLLLSIIILSAVAT